MKDTAIVIGEILRDTVTDDVDDSTTLSGFLRLCEPASMNRGMNVHNFSVYFPDARDKNSQIICEAHVLIDSIALDGVMYDVYSARVREELSGGVIADYGPKDKIWLDYVPR